jgi:hypothetical protein
MRSIVGNGARSQMRLPQRHAELMEVLQLCRDP